MKIFRIVERFLLNLIDWFWRFFVKIHERKNIKRKTHLWKQVVLTEEQKQQIDRFYKENYGKKISHKWHRLYQSYTGNFDYRYIPEHIFTTELEPIGNKRVNVMPLENKALLRNFTRGNEEIVRTPETYIMCVNGTFFDADGDIISKESAVDILKNANGGKYQAIMKKTIDTSSGRDVRLVEIDGGIDIRENEKLEDVIDSMGKNFIVQEKIVAHPAFAALYAGSINTLRVISYQTSSAIKVAPILMRIGRSGYVDNAHAGGMFIGVHDDGTLMKEAYTEYQERFTHHPVTNVAFDGYVLPKIPEISEAAIELHKNYPSLKFISWDFTVDENSNIVLIEANLHSQTVWMSQIAHGKAFFGDDTAEMLQLCKKQG